VHGPAGALRSFGCTLLASVAAVGCVSAHTTRVQAPAAAPSAAEVSCPAPLAPFVKVTLYMGRGTRNAEEWQRFADEGLGRHFPDGGTMIEVSGWWEGRVGDAADRNSRMLVMLHPASDREAFAVQVQAVIADIKARFGHRAVLWEEARICAVLSEGETPAAGEAPASGEIR